MSTSYERFRRSTQNGDLAHGHHSPKVLTPQTVTTTETFTSCSDLSAGGGFTVDSPGNVTFEAQGTIALADGFSVLSGGTFTAGSGGAPELSRRTYAYQDVQYFLTGAAGPWPENLDWTYDQIGNRLTETRTPPDGVPVTDTYQYLANDATGNTPVLDQVTLGMGGTRGYTWDAAGNLGQVAANANVIDFAFDDESRLASVGRAVANLSSDFLYDGRTFLRSAVELQGDPPAEAASVRPLYSSDGRLHALRRKAAPTDPEKLVVFFYFGGRPVAQLTIDGAGAETWTYLTTDHLGTPLLATDEAGAVVWEGGFEPFGTDWQAGTMAGASENGIYLRLPGQWDDGTWNDATSGAGVKFNVHRWYQPGTGRYTRPDPASHSTGVDIYSYARQRPLRLVDLLGLTVTFVDPRLKPFLDCARKHSLRAMSGYNYLQQDDNDWEFRVLEEGQSKLFGSNSGFMFRAVEHGVCAVDCSTVDPPGGFGPFSRPGRFWIFPEGGGCEPVMESLIHEIDERVRSTVSGRPHQAIHYEIQGPARQDAKKSCRECCPQPNWQ